ARRADGRSGPGAAARPVADVRRARRSRRHPARVHPRDGRGGPLRSGAAHAAGSRHRRRHADRTARGDRHRRHRGGVPRTGGRCPMIATVATARRVLHQLRHDPRSAGLLVLMPSVLLALFHWVYAEQPWVFERVGPQMLGLFPFILMFLITSVTMVRERLSGTLERLLTTPLARGELIGGYALGFGLVAVVQAAVSSAVAIWLLDLGVDRPWEALLFAFVGSAVGIA